MAGDRPQMTTGKVASRHNSARVTLPEANEGNPHQSSPLIGCWPSPRPDNGQRKNEKGKKEKENLNIKNSKKNNNKF